MPVAEAGPLAVGLALAPGFGLPPLAGELEFVPPPPPAVVLLVGVAAEEGVPPPP